MPAVRSAERLVQRNCEEHGCGFISFAYVLPVFSDLKKSLGFAPPGGNSSGVGRMYNSRYQDNVWSPRSVQREEAF